MGPTRTRNEGIIGEGIDLDLAHLREFRIATLEFHLTLHLLQRHFRDANKEPKHHLFGKLRRIVRQWMGDCLVCQGDTFPTQLMYLPLADMACQRISAAITTAHTQGGDKPVRVVLDPYNPVGSTRDVHFTTTKSSYWRTDPRKCHVNYAMLDSNWEGEFCRVAEAHPKVRAYVKNHNLGLEVPYRMGVVSRIYLPDFIVRVDDGEEDPLNLVVEIKGYRGEDAIVKKTTMEKLLGARDQPPS